LAQLLKEDQPIIGSIAQRRPANHRLNCSKRPIQSLAQLLKEAEPITGSIAQRSQPITGNWQKK